VPLCMFRTPPSPFGLVNKFLDFWQMITRPRGSLSIVVMSGIASEGIPPS